MNLELKPIGVFKADARYPYDVPRQGVLEASDAIGCIELEADQGYEQALSDLEGFEHIWLLYHFHHNTNWKPKTLPPRGPHVKRGVFATRSPYRPNPIGLSCVRLKKIEGLKIFVQEFDLLDGTPIFDIKPYLPYADSFPESKIGWLEGLDKTTFAVHFENEVEAALKFLESQGLTTLRGSLQTQLSIEPLDQKRKRVEEIAPDQFCLSYRTWRADFSIDLAQKRIHVTTIRSGYSASELAEPIDPYGDKDLHRQFLKHPRV